MLKPSLLMALAAGSLALSGCVVYDEPGRGPDRVVYQDNDRYYGRDHRDRSYNRDHCPPGHRKKHWC